MELKINDELKKLIPPLTEQEYKQLEENILLEGIREPIIYWNGFIVDGHNRFEIAKKHGLIYNVFEKEFSGIDDVKIWMINNQQGRRNLTDGWKYELIQVKKEILLKQGKEKKIKTLKKGDIIPDISTIDKTGHNTQKEIANELNWSTGKVATADKVWKEADNETKEKVKSGEITFNEAYRTIKKKEQGIRFEELKTKETIINGLYDVIVIDPPWKMEKIDREVSPGQTGFDYPTMEIDEIKNIKIPSEKDCHLFLWTTQKYLPDSFDILKAWNVRYVLTMVWYKNGGFQPFKLPQYNCEFILYGRIGTPEFIDTKNFFTCFQANRTGHSQKPKEFYELLRRVTFGKRIDMFNRREIDGFDRYGNEV